jgi:hypothetical protein
MKILFAVIRWRRAADAKINLPGTRLSQKYFNPLQKISVGDHAGFDYSCLVARRRGKIFSHWGRLCSARRLMRQK